MTVKAGRIFGSVPKLSAASRYEIKFPNGVAAIRGTKYLIGANGTVAVLQGLVVVTWKILATGNLLTRVISQNEAFDPVSGAVGPASPAQISEMQARLRLFKSRALKPVPFRWTKRFVACRQFTDTTGMAGATAMGAIMAMAMAMVMWRQWRRQWRW